MQSRKGQFDSPVSPL
nr:unnamed protein product [Callosobruchus chinensis]